jgi:predicted molibdopterin-dependent oxidoreductase YjgC
MDTIKLSIDGREVEAKPGQTILQAARNADITIPTLCYDQDLLPYGGCRLCIVQVEGMRGFPTSCTTQVTEGMQVTTENQVIFKTRQMILRLLMADHPADCLNCRANMNCELQSLAHEYGVTEHGLPRLRRERTVDESNPVYRRDMNKCVLCGRCVQTCQQILGLGAIDFIRRGHKTEIGPFLGGEVLDSVCESCGECVAHCPTGALSFVETAPEPDSGAQTICPYCGTGCSIMMDVRRGRIVRAKGDRNGPVNRGVLCAKGRFGSHPYVHDSGRLTSPLVRKNGKLEEVSWEEALDLVARKLKERRGEAFAAFSSAKVANEDNYMLQKFTRAVMGTNSVDHCARL